MLRDIVTTSLVLSTFPEDRHYMFLDGHVDFVTQYDWLCAARTRTPMQEKAYVQLRLMQIMDPGRAELAGAVNGAVTLPTPLDVLRAVAPAEEERLLLLRGKKRPRPPGDDGDGGDPNPRPPGDDGDGDDPNPVPHQVRRLNDLALVVPTQQATTINNITVQGNYIQGNYTENPPGPARSRAVANVSFWRRIYNQILENKKKTAVWASIASTIAALIAYTYSRPISVAVAQAMGLSKEAAEKLGIVLEVVKQNVGPGSGMPWSPTQSPNQASDADKLLEHVKAHVGEYAAKCRLRPSQQEQEDIIEGITGIINGALSKFVTLMRDHVCNTQAFTDANEAELRELVKRQLENDAFIRSGNADWLNAAQNNIVDFIMNMPDGFRRLMGEALSCPASDAPAAGTAVSAAAGLGITAAGAMSVAALSALIFIGYAVLAPDEYNLVPGVGARIRNVSRSVYDRTTDFVGSLFPNRHRNMELQGVISVDWDDEPSSVFHTADSDDGDDDDDGDGDAMDIDDYAPQPSPSVRPSMAERSLGQLHRTVEQDLEVLQNPMPPPEHLTTLMYPHVQTLVSQVRERGLGGLADEVSTAMTCIVLAMLDATKPETRNAIRTIADWELYLAHNRETLLKRELALEASLYVLHDQLVRADAADLSEACAALLPPSPPSVEDDDEEEEKSEREGDFVRLEGPTGRRLPPTRTKAPSSFDFWTRFLLFGLPVAGALMRALFPGLHMIGHKRVMHPGHPLAPWINCTDPNAIDYNQTLVDAAGKLSPNPLRQLVFGINATDLPPFCAPNAALGDLAGHKFGFLLQDLIFEIDPSLGVDVPDVGYPQLLGFALHAAFTIAMVMNAQRIRGGRSHRPWLDASLMFAMLVLIVGSDAAGALLAATAELFPH